MPPTDDNPEESVHETQEGSAGGPQRMDPTAARTRAEEPEALPDEALDDRQAAIGERRRQGGPPLEDTAGRAGADEPPPDVPETECGEDVEP